MWTPLFVTKCIKLNDIARSILTSCIYLVGFDMHAGNSYQGH